MNSNFTLEDVMFVPVEAFKPFVLKNQSLLTVKDKLYFPCIVGYA